jgi:2-phosphoglycerate kinase
MYKAKRNWDILIIGGASGSGKTSISCPLARLYEVDLVRVDDFQVFMQACTTPETHLALHTPAPHNNYEGVDAIVIPYIDIGRMFLPGLTAVVNDHVLENIPMILEGDFILPELAASFGNPKIKAIFIYETSREQILQNYFSREAELQEQRADRSYAHGNWLKDECFKLGITVIEARPWNTLMERVTASLQ